MGFRFLYCDSLVELCSYYDVAPTQLSPNSHHMWVDFKVQCFNRVWVYYVSFFRTFFSLQSNTFHIFFFQTRFPEFKDWNVGHLSWDHWSWNLRGYWWVGSNAPILIERGQKKIGRANTSFLEVASLDLWGCLKEILLLLFLSIPKRSKVAGCELLRSLKNVPPYISEHTSEARSLVLPWDLENPCR